MQRWPLSRRLTIGDTVQSCVVRGTVGSVSRAVGAKRVRVRRYDIYWGVGMWYDMRVHVILRV